MKRKITQLLMHDSAVQLMAFGAGWSEFHSEKFQLDYHTREWAQKYLNPFAGRLPDEPAIERAYAFADGDNGLEITAAYGEVKAPGVIDFEVGYRSKSSGETWTESVTYCGHFTVWWENATE